MEYHKINGLYKRYNKIEHPQLPEGVHYNDFIVGEFALPEFEYLFENTWVWSEKLDGTNIRIYLTKTEDGFTCSFKGRTDAADVPKPLLLWLENFCNTKPFTTVFTTLPVGGEVILYGEGVGVKIQGGGHFGEQHFKLFDVKVGKFWLEKKAVAEVGIKLGLDTPPVWYGTIQEAIDKVKEKPLSYFGEFVIEGFVGQPLVRLNDAQGNRIVTKIKVKDFVKKEKRHG